MIKAWKKRVEPLVMHEWTEEEYQNLSPWRFYTILFTQFLYFDGVSNLFSKEFRELLFSKKRLLDGLSFIDDKIFQLCYYLRLILIVDDSICVSTHYRGE